MRNSSFSLTLLLSVAATGCGVTFDDIATDESVPSELRARAVLKDGGANVLQPQRVLGVAYKLPRTGGGQLILPTDRVGKLPPTGTDKLKIQSPLRYQSKVTAKVATQAAYMTFAADIQVNRVLEVTISDLESYVTKPEPTDAQLQQFVDGLGGIGDGDRVLIVTAITLSGLTYKGYTKTDSSAKVQGGAFGFEGSVYTSSENFALDYLLGINYAVVTKTVSSGAAEPLTTYDIQRVTADKVPDDLKKLIEADRARWVKLGEGSSE